jgi:hypothetical protein
VHQGSSILSSNVNKGEDFQGKLLAAPSPNQFSCLMQELSHEAIMWKQFRHPNILPFLGVCLEMFAPRYCLISPWMSNGTIIQFLEKNPGHDRHKSV